ncbi:TIGR00730 family Rossman fold protein [Paenibacillus sp. 481]|uniref:LOG family protein n=1 Tax=Paenibacillus sp. 481 TaxID=2835869 RepID=UPI001E41C5EA|nr:TIGR00730 family Rossman fold protein [Paenibacillus sp. 481]UHA72181.1 TIGR00730 family Rossman fold protein [Paenibacillus sp. 481]
MNKICVFAGSNLGVYPDYAEQARELGKLMAARDIELIYGGSVVGLMGEVANEVLKHGGKVTGIMPRGLFRGEMVHTQLTKLIEVADMHERKATMNQLSDAFIALPGGLGTYEEMFEVLSWAQLGIHHKPAGLLNVRQFYTPLLDMVDHSIEAGFVKEEHKQLLLSAPDAASLLSQLQTYIPPVFGNKWNQLS